MSGLISQDTVHDTPQGRVTAQCILEGGVSERICHQFCDYCSPPSPLFGNPATSLRRERPIGFAPTPHDGFAFLAEHPRKRAPAHVQDVTTRGFVSRLGL